MARFTKDHTRISQPTCLELDKGSYPVENRACTVRPGEQHNQQPPSGKKQPSTRHPSAYPQLSSQPWSLASL
jgi:hypothetical protein